MEMTYDAVVTIRIGKSLFLHRITSEGKHDRLWLSTKGDHCHSPSSADIDLGSGNVPLYYELPADGTIVIFTMSALRIPVGFPVAIHNEIVTPQDWFAIENRQARGEIHKITVNGPSAVCLG